MHFEQEFEFEQEVLHNSIFDKEREDNVIMEMLNLILHVILSIIFQPVIWTHISRSNCSALNC